MKHMFNNEAWKNAEEQAIQGNMKPLTDLFFNAVEEVEGTPAKPIMVDEPLFIDGVDVKRAKYVDMNKLCQDDVEYITHTGFYAPLPKGAKCVHCGAIENLGTQEGEVVCEECAMSQGE